MKIINKKKFSRLIFLPNLKINRSSSLIKIQQINSKMRPTRAKLRQRANSKHWIYHKTSKIYLLNKDIRF